MTISIEEKRAMNCARVKAYLARTGKRQYCRIIKPEWAFELDALLKKLRDNDKKSDKKANQRA